MCCWGDSRGSQSLEVNFGIANANEDWSEAIRFVITK
jgi:hypothetical protein